MKKHNERILTEADYSNMLPSAFDNSKKTTTPAKIPQKMDWSGTLPDFISGNRASTPQPTPQKTQTPEKLATDLVVQDKQKNASSSKQISDQPTAIPVLNDGYEIFTDISKLNGLFDNDTVTKIKKDLENAPTSTMTNINGKSGDLARGIDEITIYGNNNSAKINKELLRNFYMLYKSDNDKNIAYFGLKRNIGNPSVKHINMDGMVEVVEFESGKILVLNQDIFKVLFK